VLIIILSSKIAQDVAAAAPSSKAIIIDAFSGAGGNSVAFALSGRWKRVYAIELDPAVLACAKHNAEIYGVKDKITWFVGDCMQILHKELKDLAPFSVLFASPPWGGEQVFLLYPSNLQLLR
jgi:trimethylguanosine synthase